MSVWIWFRWWRPRTATDILFCHLGVLFRIGRDARSLLIDFARNVMPNLFAVHVANDRKFMRSLAHLCASGRPVTSLANTGVNFYRLFPINPHCALRV